MREILFRGKHKTGGDWYYGNLEVSNGGVATITPDSSLLGSYGQVDPATVGQYTGLTDKNGKKIFEGDIVHMNSKKFCLSGHGVVVYRNGGFAIDDRKRNRSYPFMQNGQYNAGDYRVDGNIHDHKELLKGGAPDGV